LISNSSQSEADSPRLLGIFFIPSAADLIFVLVLAGLSTGLMPTRLLNDAGIGWHIRNGEHMLLAHTVTRADPFSSTKAGAPWFAWEWLFDLLVGSVHFWTGLNGVVFLAALIVALTFSLAFRLMVKLDTGPPIAAALLVLALTASAIHFFARPHVFSWLFTVLWFWLLDGYDTGEFSSRRLIWLPFLMVFWVNIHGGFLLGIILPVIYAAGRLITWLRERQALAQIIVGKKVRWLATISGLCALASLINPYGYRLHIHIYRYLSDRFLMDHIEEFLSPNFHGFTQRCFVVLLLTTFIAVAATPRRPRPTPGLLLLFAAYSALYAARNIPIASLLLILVSGPLLSQAVAAGDRASVARPLRAFFAWLRNLGTRTARLELAHRLSIWPAIAILAGVWICAHQGNLGTRQIMRAHFDEKRFPVALANDIQSLQFRQSSTPTSQAAILAPDFWGGYLIYRLFPEYKVVVDDRHDFYGDEFIHNYLKVIRIDADWSKVLDEWRVNLILIPRGSSLSNILKETPSWTIRREDEVAVLFARVTPLQ
jgi:hypothetical protein